MAIIHVAPIQISNARGDENVQAEVIIIFFSSNTSHVQQIRAKNDFTHVIYTASNAKAKLIIFLCMLPGEAVYLWQG